MFRKFIKQVTEGSKLIISGKEYTAIGKTFYVSQNVPDGEYVKIILNDHSVLLIVPFAKIACIGKLHSQFGADNFFAESLLYNQVNYNKIDEDFQIVTKIEFGDPLVCEGEVKYATYVNDKDDTTISLGYVLRTKERADVITNNIDINAIEIKQR